MQTPVNTTLLKVGSAILVGFGVLIALAAWPPTSGLVEFLVDLSAWPLDGGQTLAANETRLALAIAGGVMAGWGAMVWIATGRLADTDPAFLRTMVLVPTLIWYVVDSLGSVASGIPVNVLVNTLFLALFFAAFAGRRQPTEA